MSSALSPLTAAPFDPQTVRADFPILDRKVYGRPLVYLDNAATTQKPKVVMDALVDYYSRWAATGDDNAPKYRAIAGVGSVDEITARARAALS